MVNTTLNQAPEATEIKAFALKNYKTYLEHYKLKNLAPMSFEEFYKNYAA